MQGNRSVVMVRGPPVECKSQMQNYRDNQRGVSYSEKCMTYSVGKRLLSLKITQMHKENRVNVVQMDIVEESGKGFSANFNLQFIRNGRYGILCNMGHMTSGSYELFKKNYCMSPLPDTELARYSCRETGDGSSFIIEKKKSDNNNDVVERVKGTHTFHVGEETLSVKVKITNDRRAGLRVEVEGPVKLTMDYSKHVFTKIIKKMDNEIWHNVFPDLPRNAIAQLPQPNGSDRGLGSDGRTSISMNVRDKIPVPH